MVSVNRICLQVTKTSPQLFFEPYVREEALKKNQTLVRGQVLRLESNIQSGSGFTSNCGFAMFHISGFPVGWYVVLVNVYCTNAETTFLFYVCMSMKGSMYSAFQDGDIPTWLNFTRSELKPHAVLMEKYCFLQVRNDFLLIIYATGR